MDNNSTKAISDADWKARTAINSSFVKVKPREFKTDRNHIVQSGYEKRPGKNDTYYVKISTPKYPDPNVHN